MHLPARSGQPKLARPGRSPLRLIAFSGLLGGSQQPRIFAVKYLAVLVFGSIAPAVDPAVGEIESIGFGCLPQRERMQVS